MLATQAGVVFNELSILVPSVGLRPMMADDGSSLVRPCEDGDLALREPASVPERPCELRSTSPQRSCSTVGQSPVSAMTAASSASTEISPSSVRFLRPRPNLGPGIFASVFKRRTVLAGRFPLSAANRVDGQQRQTRSLDLPWEIHVDSQRRWRGRRRGRPAEVPHHRGGLPCRRERDVPDVVIQGVTQPSSVASASCTSPTKRSAESPRSVLQPAQLLQRWNQRVRSVEPWIHDRRRPSAGGGKKGSPSGTGRPVRRC